MTPTPCTCQKPYCEECESDKFEWIVVDYQPGFFRLMFRTFWACFIAAVVGGLTLILVR